MLLQPLVQLAVFWSILLPGVGTGEVDVQRNLAYGEACPLRLDLYRPADRTAPCPVVVIVHGGLWIWGTNRDYRDLCFHLARNGIACAPIDFRHTPPGGFRDQVSDIKAAIRWVRSNAAALDLDPGRIGLFGSSSGGHLASLAGLAGDGEGLGDDPPGTSSRVQALFLLYGVYDLAPHQDQFLIRAYAGEIPPSGDPDWCQAFASATYVDGSEPPTLIMHGAEDRTVPPSQAEALAASLRGKGIATELVLAEGLPHGFAKTMPWTRPMVCGVMYDFFHDQL